MSYYYKYDFISPEPIYATVREELKSYFDSGAIDDALFETWTDKCLRKIGKGSYYIAESVIHLEDFQSRLPDNFYKLREAWMCTEVDGMPYRSSNSFYSEAATIDTIKVTPVTSSDPCIGDCMPDMIQTVYKTNNEINQVFRKAYLLTPGNISTLDNCDAQCINIGASSPDSFDIHGNKFITNFRKGTVYLIFYAQETDELGQQMIPDNYRVREYIEAFIKYKCFEMLSNQIVDETFNQINQKKKEYEQKSDEAWILCDSEIKKQDVYAKARAIKRQRNSFNMYELPTRPKTMWKR